MSEYQAKYGLGLFSVVPMKGQAARVTNRSTRGFASV